MRCPIVVINWHENYREKMSMDSVVKCVPNWMDRANNHFWPAAVIAHSKWTSFIYSVHCVRQWLQSYTSRSGSNNNEKSGDNERSGSRLKMICICRKLDLLRMDCMQCALLSSPNGVGQQNTHFSTGLMLIIHYYYADANNWLNAFFANFPAIQVHPATDGSLWKKFMRWMHDLSMLFVRRLQRRQQMKKFVWLYLAEIMMQNAPRATSVLHRYHVQRPQARLNYSRVPATWQPHTSKRNR